MAPAKKNVANVKPVASVQGVRRRVLDDNVQILPEFPDRMPLPCGCRPKLMDYMAELACCVALKHEFGCSKHLRSFVVPQRHKSFAQLVGRFLLSSKNAHYTDDLRYICDPVPSEESDESDESDESEESDVERRAD